ncbi:MAG: aminofutalosine synthase MqnE [Elusimicrobia bacterium]|nr:aminofutalosine synthase MqnE [Candidatus Obscuribacterium magneticum]
MDFVKDRDLLPVWNKIQKNIRLDRNDGLSLFRSRDLHGMGGMANFVKEKKNGKIATFVLNRQINPTNICVLSCRFCHFSAKPGTLKAYAYSFGEILSKISPELKEVHITGSLHPEWTFDVYLRIVREIKNNFPTIQIKAFTAVEIDYFSKLAGKPVDYVLEKLMEAGVESLPGGGAEVFSDRIRHALFPLKIGADRWLEIHRKAHQLGLRSNATLLYGHIETDEEKVDHMLKLRGLQDETGGFLSFVPLAYQPGTLSDVTRRASVFEDLKTIAIGRLLLDNFEHIKAYWVTLGEETASVALHFGADDLDGTVGEEKIMHAASATSPVQMARDRLVQLIREAGLEPVERDGLFRQELREVLV